MAKKKELDKITKGIIRQINTNSLEFFKGLEEAERENEKLQRLSIEECFRRFTALGAWAGWKKINLFFYLQNYKIYWQIIDMGVWCMRNQNLF